PGRSPRPEAIFSMYGLGFAKSRQGPGRRSSLAAHGKLRNRRRSNAEKRGAGWWAVTVSNCRPPGCKPGALPTELTALDPAAPDHATSARRANKKAKPYSSKAPPPE